jgi:hypothetical protein
MDRTMPHRETGPAPSSPGSVVLDIGDDVGAAIVLTPASLAGHEIEIRFQNSVWAGRHVAVLERRLPAGPTWAAVFPSLTEGRWEIRVRHNPTSPIAAFDVAGGHVTTTRLSTQQ